MVAFFVILFNPLMCPPEELDSGIPRNVFGGVVVQGTMYNAVGAPPPLNTLFEGLPGGTDVTEVMFTAARPPSCVQSASFRFANVPTQCEALPNACQNLTQLRQFGFPPYRVITFATGQVRANPVPAYEWADIKRQQLVAVNDHVLDFTSYFRANPDPIPNDPIDTGIRQAQQLNDGSHIFSRVPQLSISSPGYDCLVSRYRVGRLSELSGRCILSRLITILAAIVVMGILFCRFFMAIFFSWFLSHRLARTPDRASMPLALHHADRKEYSKDIEMSGMSRLPGVVPPPMTDDELDLYSILLVTCYSEGEGSLRTTMESLAATSYPDDKKLLFVVADGIITGKGNPKSTPDLVLDMLVLDGTFGEPQPCSYLAVASGPKKHNMAKVYCGHFVQGAHTVPTIVIVKCGTPEESTAAKPGNRGKRDSQIVLMNFLTRVLLNDRMTPLDHDLFRKIHHITRVTPDRFELVLMVDADTRVMPSSMRVMVNSMNNDPFIMGLCGETRIANKTQSWVTTIQVFEYYISHHLGKAFESVFGGVTCLPGCFCMYRIKARKEDKWIPVLANPDIVEQYSTDEVDTLHQKNLLLLGEDRFLTTLMLRTFTNRKMVFVPKAVCKTVVPDDFATLLSQRRRWINSTIHNLMELVLVNNLCGTFCFSMQFVIFMDLIGTAVLPASLLATIYLVVNTVVHSDLRDPSQLINLLTLAVTLFFPALVVFFSARRLHYVGWMLIYLLALPIWNIVLPVYAFWHFDDFSWGATRQISGAGGKGDKDGHGGDGGVFDGT
ncbi:hypothetical protein HK104_004701, partial [Borealophlyctis nickersoniae]